MLFSQLLLSTSSPIHSPDCMYPVLDEALQTHNCTSKFLLYPAFKVSRNAFLVFWSWRCTWRDVVALPFWLRRTDLGTGMIPSPTLRLSYHLCFWVESFLSYILFIDSLNILHYRSCVAPPPFLLPCFCFHFQQQFPLCLIVGTFSIETSQLETLSRRVIY